MAQRIDTVVVAKMIRKELKAAFPSVKFSVKSSRYTGGSSINVSWQNGPTDKMVNEVIGHFHGATFNGMEDIKEYHTTELNGEEVRFGNDFLFTSRDIDDEYVQMIIDIAIDAFDCIPEGTTVENRWKLNYQDSRPLSDMISNANFLDMTTKWCSYRDDYYMIETGEFVKVEKEEEVTDNLDATIEVEEEETVDMSTVQVEEVEIFVDDVRFANLNKNNTLAQYEEEIALGADAYHIETCRVTRVVRMSQEQFDSFSNTLLVDYSFIAGFGGCNSHYDVPEKYADEYIWNMPDCIQEAWRAESFRDEVVAVVSPTGETLYVDPQGSRYSKHVGLGAPISIPTIDSEYVSVEPEIIEDEQPREEITNVIKLFSAVKTTEEDAIEEVELQPRPEPEPQQEAEPVTADFSFSFTFSGAVA